MATLRTVHVWLARAGSGPVDESCEVAPKGIGGERGASPAAAASSAAPQAAQIMELLRSLGEAGSCQHIAQMQADEHQLITFNATQKATGAVLERLAAEFGVGVHAGARVDVLPLLSTTPAAPAPSGKRRRQFAISDRMSLPEIFERVDIEAHLTCDFITLTVVASVIAAVGLVCDSAVTLVAAMLVSPLMGQVMALALGASTCDRESLCRVRTAAAAPQPPHVCFRPANTIWWGGGRFVTGREERTLRGGDLRAGRPGHRAGHRLGRFPLRRK